MMSWSKLWRRLLLAAGSLVGAVVLAEVVFRLFLSGGSSAAVLFDANGNRRDLGEIYAFLRENMRGELGGDGPIGGLPPDLSFHMGYEPRGWDYFDASGCVLVKSNSLGFRDLDFPRHKRPGELRILAIGDSFTFGLGLTLELTWVQQLEQLLRKDRSTPVEVVNGGFACRVGPFAESGGIIGHAPAHYGWWVENLAFEVQPDVLIVGFCLNDMGPIPLLTYEVVKRVPALGGWSKLLEHADWVKRQRQARDEDRSAVVRQLEEKVGAMPDWQNTQKGLVSIRDSARKRNVPVVVVVFPMLSELERYPLGPLHAMVRTFCAKNEIRCLDLMDVFAGCGIDDEQFWVHMTDQHPNHNAAARIAARLREYLTTEGLVK